MKRRSERPIADLVSLSPKRRASVPAKLVDVMRW
jgi:hypothetical protein